MIYPYLEYEPKVKDTVFIAPGARVVGRVEIEDNVGIWFNTVVRGDVDVVRIGPGTNIQDGCVLHEDKGYPLIIGARVTVGHKAILHGCIIEDGALIGMGAIVLSGAKVGAGAVVGAGSLVKQGQTIPPNALAIGSPAKVIRELTEEETENFSKMAELYMERARQFKGQ